MAKYIGILILFIPSLALSVSSNDIQQLKTNIQHLQQDIQEKQTSRLALQETLQQAEVNLAALHQQRSNTTQQLKAQTHSLQTLTQQENMLNANIALQQQQLIQQIRAAYKLGRENYLKILLNQENPTQISRNLKYYQYLTRYRLNLVQQLNTNLQKLESIKQNILHTNAQMVQLQSQLQNQIQQIKANQLLRQQSLSQMNTSINTKQQRLAALLADKQALENVIQHLDKESTNVQGTSFTAKNSPHQDKPLTTHLPDTSLHEQISFALYQGKLAWPTKGSLASRFNTPIEDSELKSTGVVINAPRGQKVYAVAPGKVVFAQWMSGYGLLLIIDHGQGYMTLYGRNSNIYKKVGETVAKNEAIATVGDSGGYPQSGLYFAIRKQGTPVNPSQWCSLMR